VNRREFMRVSGAAVTAALVGTPAFAEGKPIKIGYNVATLANPFFRGMTKGVVGASSNFPGMTLLHTNANGDANTQSTMVVDLINEPGRRRADPESDQRQRYRARGSTGE
jgi:ABC-type sugar transport system substrate-binding protein